MIGQDAGKSFAYILGVYLGDGAVTKWTMEGRSDRLIFRLNTIDEDFARATKAALEQLSTYKVTIGCHAVSKSSKPNWTIAFGDRELCQRLVDETAKKQTIPSYVWERPFDTDNWNAGVLQSEAWAAKPTSSDLWTTRTQQAETWTPAIIQPDPWTTE